MRPWSAVLASLLIFPALAGAQQSKKNDDMQGMPGMNDGQMQGMQMGGDGLITMHPETFLQEIARHAGTGTSAETNSSQQTGLWAWSSVRSGRVFSRHVPC